MTSKRRTFHVDWDSPSTQTGTVKRRPASMSVATTSSTCFNSTEFNQSENHHVCGFNRSRLTATDEAKSLDKQQKLHRSGSLEDDLNMNIGGERHIELGSVKLTSRLAVKREFGLKLSKDVTWKPKRKSRGNEKPSSIPKPKITSSTSRSKLVNSSSESSGIGSPLSPLSPQNDTRGSIKNSSSKSSGIGSPESPGSPLSPDSQQYSAIHLIQQQLEKLHNCSCERRQAEVKFYVQLSSHSFFYKMNLRPAKVLGKMM
uniref:Uncharacterized protein n=1 Tax=Bracon brevicornis TaxID=1563983 RepID=A0A6V7JS98_9HYME